MEAIYADQIVKSNHQDPGLLGAVDRVPSSGNGEFEVLGVEKVSKDRISP